MLMFAGVLTKPMSRMVWVALEYFRGVYHSMSIANECQQYSKRWWRKLFKCTAIHTIAFTKLSKGHFFPSSV